MIWARPFGRPSFCAIAAVADSIAIPECRETFASYNTVEVDEKPSHEQRCPSCVDVLVERRMQQWAQSAPGATP